MKINIAFKSIAGVFLIVTLFIVASYIVHNNSDFFSNYIRDDFQSKVLYIFILIVSAVFAPVDVIFMMPLATTTWGWITAGLLSLIGWTIGSVVVFFISRKYGAPLIKKHIPLNKIYKYERFMPQTNIFTGIIFLRIAIPIDFISYAIGLFTNIKFIPYFFATIIGFLPMAFSLAYIGTLSVYMQIMSFIFFSVVVSLGVLSIKHKKLKAM